MVRYAEHPVLTPQELERFETLKDIKEFMALFTRPLPISEVIP